MNQFVPTVLINTAIAEVVKCCESFVDFEAAETEDLARLEAVAQSLGLSLDGRQQYDESLEDPKQDILEIFKQQARIEVQAAVREVEEMRRIHACRLNDFRKHRLETERMIKDHHEQVISENSDDHFTPVINSFHENLLRAYGHLYHELMKIIQRKYRLELEHCFIRHMVSEKTAKQLAEYYEVRVSS